MNSSLTRTAGGLLFLLCLFPYTTVLDLKFDVQPYAVVSAAILLATLTASDGNLFIPKILLPYLIVFTYALIIFLFSDFSLSAARSLIGYASVFLFAAAAFHSFKYVKAKYFVGAVFLWLTCGLIQTVISKQFGSALLSRLSTSPDRGVTSFAPEPSAYATICLFFLILNGVFHAKGEYPTRTYWILFFALAVQLMLARAGVGILLFAVYLVAVAISKSTFPSLMKSLFASSVFLLGAVATIRNIPALQSGRIGRLLDGVFSDPIGLALSDGSTSDRLSHILLSHLSLFYSNGKGYGFGHWTEAAPEIASNQGGLVLQIFNTYATTEGRIMSGWGTAIFELGFVGVFLVVSFLVLMQKGIARAKGEMRAVHISSTITIYFAILMAVPMTFPLFGYLLGIFVSIAFDSKAEHPTTARRDLPMNRLKRPIDLPRAYDVVRN